MNYEQFLAVVGREANTDRGGAEGATRATLETLAERLSGAKARQLAEHLPPELMGWLRTRGELAEPEGFDVDEFLRRVAEREGVDMGAAERHARAVFAAVRWAVGPDEMEAVAEDLPKDLDGIFWDIPTMATGEFLNRVAQRTGLDLDGADRATEAVLETLAERIAGGDVDDLIGQLPVELHAPLKRGMARGGGRARRMPAQEFLQRVAEREGVSLEQARDHARAVLDVLREAVDQEFFDIAVQLPNEYWVLPIGP